MMPTMEEIRTEWKGIRSALGNLICYIDGKVADGLTIEESFQKGYDKGVKDGIRISHSNADKFVEVFGFMPGYEIMEDGRSYFPCFEDEFWNAEYKPPHKPLGGET